MGSQRIPYSHPHQCFYEASVDVPEGGDAIADAEWHYRHCPSSLGARVQLAAFQPADFTAASITAVCAVVVADAANADALFAPLPPALPAERHRIVHAAAASAASQRSARRQRSAYYT
jgi:hypothetical protein